MSYSAAKIFSVCLNRAEWKPFWLSAKNSGLTFGFRKQQMNPEATVDLKRCTPNDIPLLREVAEQSYREHYLYLWKDEGYAHRYMQRSFSTESLTQQMADPDAFFFFVTRNGVPVGFVKLNENKNPLGRRDEKSLELERIYLLQEASGKGIGTTVLNNIVQSAAEKGKEVIWLKSMGSSPSVCFYEKTGFKRTGSEQLPFEGLKDEYRTIITMQRRLK